MYNFFRLPPPIRKHNVLSVFKRIFIIFAIFFVTEYTNAQIFPYCIDLNDGCSDEIYQGSNFIDLSSLPGLSGCTMHVGYYYRKCPPPRFVQIIYWGWTQVTPNDPPLLAPASCNDAFGEYINKLYLSTNSDTYGYQLLIKNLSLIVGNQITEQLLLEEINKLSDISKLGCFGGKSSIATEFYEGACKSLCVGRNPKKKKWVFRTGTCGVNCCKMNVFYCVDMANSTPGNVKLTNMGNSISSDASGCENPTGDPTSVDFQCERGVDGEPSVIWLASHKCTSICSANEVTNKISNNGGIEDIIPFNKEIHLSKDLGNSYLNVNIFPNPARELINLRFNSIFHGKVQLFDAAGKELLNQVVDNEKEIQFNVSLFPEGIYTLFFNDINGDKIAEKIYIMGN